jgi:hypothetical protein
MPDHHYLHHRAMRQDLESFLEVLIREDMLDDPESVEMFAEVATALLAPRKSPYIKRRRRDISTFTDAECRVHFRFESKDDLRRLLTVFDFPETFMLSNRSYVSGEEALLILLARFSYPGRWTGLMSMFGGGAGFLSEAMYKALDHIHADADELLGNLSRYGCYFPEWAAAVANKRGADSGDVCLFIDGTLRKMCRPGILQKEVYSGHKRCHGLKYQSVSAPCGLIVDMFGAVSGRRHDMFVLRESRILSRLQEVNDAIGRIFRMYGDPAYPLTDLLIRAFRGVNLTAEQVDFNKEMNAMRTSVEWAFGKVVQYMGYIDFKAAMKLREAPLSKFYKVAVILTNCHTCLYKSGVVTAYFECNPPCLEAYVRGVCPCGLCACGAGV